VVKTRLQVSGEGTRNYKALGISGSLSVIAKEEGVGAFWKGIGAAWMREASYTSLRLGLYAPIKSALGVKKDSSFFMKFFAGGLAGALGSIVGNPFDVVKTRMMAAEGKTIPSMGSTFAELHRAQGMAGFYRGLEANVMRAVVLNGTKMACYDQIKGELVKAGVVPAKGIFTDFLAAFGAGFFMTCTVAPFDKIRTRLMNQPADAKLYTGFLDCAVKIVKAEGPGGLWAGFLPIWARFACVRGGGGGRARARSVRGCGRIRY
jgi:hypothetical protein